MTTVLLAHGGFPERAKTAVGVLRYGDRDVVAVLDRDAAGGHVRDHLPGLPAARDAPIVAGMDEIEECEELLVGIAPIGGGFEAAWRPDVRQALERGCDVVAGLHYFLAEDAEFRALAEEYGGEIRDVRRPPEDLTVARGIADEVDATVVLTVGTDCSVGKMTTTCELVRTARERGLDAAFVPTGQTGVLIEGWGVPVDRVVSDFVAGAVERMVVERGDHDYLFVEGQGSITHPAYSAVTCGILHGAMPDSLVLCHDAGRAVVHGYEEFALPSPSTTRSLYEELAEPVQETQVVAGALDTRNIGSDAEARAAVESYAAATDAPATDPVRFGVDGDGEAGGDAGAEDGEGDKGGEGGEDDSGDIESVLGAVL
jgi:uncharacterized NAD-dependent epimerase/dehydratase family protein